MVVDELLDVLPRGRRGVFERVEHKGVVYELLDKVDECISAVWLCEVVSSGGVCDGSVWLLCVCCVRLVHRTRGRDGERERVLLCAVMVLPYHA